jgi:hypothetical protein
VNRIDYTACISLDVFPAGSIKIGAVPVVIISIPPDKKRCIENTIDQRSAEAITKEVVLHKITVPNKIPLIVRYIV